jgi:hypothetical protein
MGQVHECVCVYMCVCGKREGKIVGVGCASFAAIAWGNPKQIARSKGTMKLQSEGGRKGWKGRSGLE